MRKKFHFEWEELDEETERAKVIGGWIVFHNFSDGESMVFVADIDHEWQIIPAETKFI